MSVLCLYIGVCMFVANIGPYIKTRSSLLWICRVYRPRHIQVALHYCFLQSLAVWCARFLALLSARRTHIR